MLHAAFQEARADDSRRLIFVSNEEARQQELVVGLTLRGRIFLWSEEVPCSISDTHDLQVEIRWPLCEERSLPPALATIGHFAQLHLPSQFVPQLAPMATKVTGQLRIYGDKPATIPESACFSRLRSLLVSDVAKVTFSPGSFPMLSKAVINLDPKGRILTSVLACKSLGAVGVGPTRNADHLFDRLGELPNLRFLRLNRGDVSSLDGVERLPVTNLLLHDMRKLRDIRALGRSIALEELSLRYCKHIEDVSVLAQIPRLRRLEFFGCGQIGLERVLPQLQSRNLLELHLSNSLPRVKTG